IGGTVVLIGLALVILPGPAFVVIPAGLAILATEFAWARRWLHRAKAMLTRNSKQAAASARNQ
ncbi:MAG: PGPGW domain-containing protein, partial [Verrucomicrobiota bacterium]